jgi:hypothetical protein
MPVNQDILQSTTCSGCSIINSLMNNPFFTFSIQLASHSSYCLIIIRTCQCTFQMKLQKLSDTTVHMQTLEKSNIFTGYGNMLIMYSIQLSINWEYKCPVANFQQHTAASAEYVTFSQLTLTLFKVNKYI